MRIGIMGGTFDPVHYAHLFIAEQARVVCGLERVLFVPNRLPAHKESEGVSGAQHRCEMVRLAIADNPGFELSLVEMERPGPSYTVDTLRALQEKHPGAELYFITGSDSVAEMPTWYHPTEILKLCRLATAERPGYSFKALRRTLPREYTERMVELPRVLMDVSATEIRRQAAEGLPIRYLMPDAVTAYIEREKLYQISRE